MTKQTFITVTGRSPPEGKSFADIALEHLVPGCKIEGVWLPNVSEVIVTADIGNGLKRNFHIAITATTTYS